MAEQDQDQAGARGDPQAEPAGRSRSDPRPGGGSTGQGRLAIFQRAHRWRVAFVELARERGLRAEDFLPDRRSNSLLRDLGTAVASRVGYDVSYRSIWNFVQNRSRFESYFEGKALTPEEQLEIATQNRIEARRSRPGKATRPRKAASGPPPGTGRGTPSGRGSGRPVVDVFDRLADELDHLRDRLDALIESARQAELDRDALRELFKRALPRPRSDDSPPKDGPPTKSPTDSTAPRDRLPT